MWLIVCFTLMFAVPLVGVVCATVRDDFPMWFRVCMVVAASAVMFDFIMFIFE